MKLIVADASPLIIMARSETLQTLAEVAGQILVPETVYCECAVVSKPGGSALSIAARNRIIQRIPDPTLPEGLAHAELDAGEKFAIAAAANLSCRVLIDERRARQMAKHLGVPIVGSAGVLLKAKELGLVKEIRPVLHLWKSYGYFMSDALLAQVLAAAGESEGTTRA